MPMKILVCISHVPDTTSKINFVDNNTKFDTTGVQFIIGPYDDYALARAIELKEAMGATVTVLNVGTIDTEPTIRKALAIGADDAVRVDAFPTDSLFVARQIATHAKDFDLILFPNRGHGFGNEPYMIRRRWDYFVKHLLGVEPPREFELKPPAQPTLGN